jgi:hypothetical protein
MSKFGERTIPGRGEFKVVSGGGWYHHEQVSKAGTIAGWMAKSMSLFCTQAAKQWQDGDETSNLTAGRQTGTCDRF